MARIKFVVNTRESNPVVTDDLAHGFIVGSLILNTITGIMWQCESNTNNNAVWVVNTMPPKEGGFYSYNKSITFNIITSNVYHALGLRTAGDIVAGMLSGFTFAPGRIVDANILNEINPSSNILQIECSTAHGLNTNDIVTLAGMNNAGHNGVTKVTRVDATKFNCQNIVYITGAGASGGVVYEPAYLQANVNSAGIYSITFKVDGTASGSNKDWKWELNKGITPLDNVVCERVTTATLASVMATGNIEIADGDRIWISGKNITDTTDYTIKHLNINLHRINAVL